MDSWNVQYFSLKGSNDDDRLSHSPAAYYTIQYRPHEANITSTLHHHYITTCSCGMPIRGSFPQFITNWTYSLTIIRKNAGKPHKTIIWQFLGLWNLKVHVRCYNQKERREGVKGESEEERERKKQQTYHCYHQIRKPQVKLHELMVSDHSY